MDWMTLLPVPMSIRTRKGLRKALTLSRDSMKKPEMHGLNSMVSPFFLGGTGALKGTLALSTCPMSTLAKLTSYACTSPSNPFNICVSVKYQMPVRLKAKSVKARSLGCKQGQCLIGIADSTQQTGVKNHSSHQDAIVIPVALIPVATVQSCRIVGDCVTIEIRDDEGWLPRPEAWRQPVLDCQGKGVKLLLQPRG